MYMYEYIFYTIYVSLNIYVYIYISSAQKHEKLSLYTTLRPVIKNSLYVICFRKKKGTFSYIAIENV
jgi:hypothetical protein